MFVLGSEAEKVLYVKVRYVLEVKVQPPCQPVSPGFTDSNMFI